MAKRYARVNWQNSPSTTTPLNADNLNKMDKGIDDLDNAIEELNNNLGNFQNTIIVLSGNTSKTITFTGVATLFITSNRTDSVAYKSAVIVLGGTSNIKIVELQTASNITYSATNNALTITNNASSTAYLSVTSMLYNSYSIN